MPTYTGNIDSKLPRVGTTIFTVITCRRVFPTLTARRN